MRPSDPNATFADPEDGPAAAAPAAARFRIEDELARGGLGRVLRGVDTHLDREVAIKTLLRNSPAARARFERETRLTARLQHPNIVPVYDGGVDAEGLPFLAMRLVRGRTLSAEIERCGTLGDRLRLLPAVIAACNAVAYAHHQRVTHRDLKPDNLLLGDFGETLVIDWGLAKDLDALEEPTDPGELPSGNTGSLTRVGSVVGTPTYMPPEQAAGRPVDVRADVYALGAVLYQVLAGRAPYDGAPDVLAAVVAGPPVPVVDLAPGAPRDLVAVVDKAMARDPAARYADAQALAAELERFQAGRFVGAHHYTLTERAVRLVRQNPLTTGLSLALVVGGVAAVVALAAAWRVAEQRRADAEVARADAEALQRSERERLVASTIEQARLLVDHDPARSLALLTGLPPGAPFDGLVRTVAAAATSTELPTPLPGPADGGLQGFAWVGDVPVAAWGTEVRAYLPGGPRVLATDPDGRLHVVVPVDGGVATCAGPVVSRLWLDGRRSDTPLGGECLSLAVLPDGAPIALRADGALGPVPASGPAVFAPSVGSFQMVSAAGDGSWVAAGDPTGRVVWSGDPGRPMPVGVAAYGLSASPFGTEAVWLGADPVLVHLTWADGRLRARTVPVQAGWLEHAAWTAPGVVWVGGGDPAVVRVDLARGATEQVALPAPVRTLAALPGRGEVVIATQDGGVMVLDATTREQTRLAGTERPASSFVPAPDGRAVLVGSSAGLASQPLGQTDGRVLHLHGARIRSLVPQPGGGLWVVGGSGIDELGPDGVVTHRADEPAVKLVRCGDRWWVGEADGGVRELGGPVVATLPTWIEGMSCTPDGARLSAGSRNRSVVLDARTGATLRSVDGSALAVDRDGSVWVAADDEVLRLPPGDGAVERISEPGRTYVITASPTSVWSGTSTGVVWSLAPELRRVGHLSGLVGVLVPVGEGWVAGDEHGGVRYWRTPTAAPEDMPGHRLYVGEGEVRPGGRFVATGAWDDLVWLWDLSASPPAGRPLRGHADAITALAWSIDGATLYSGDRSGVVRAWTDPLPLQPEALRAEVLRRAALIAPR